MTQDEGKQGYSKANTIPEILASWVLKKKLSKKNSKVKKIYIGPKHFR